MIIKKVFLRSTEKISKSELLKRVLVLLKCCTSYLQCLKLTLQTDGQPDATSSLLVLLSKSVYVWYANGVTPCLLVNSYRYSVGRSATETLVIISLSPGSKIPEDLNLQEHRYLNLKSHKANKYRVGHDKVARIPFRTVNHNVTSGNLNMIRRAQLSTDAGGNHFQHLWWCILSAFGCCINFCTYVMLGPGLLLRCPFCTS
jgi:hypothetical protein